MARAVVMGMMRRAGRVLEVLHEDRSADVSSARNSLPAGINRAVGAGWERPRITNKPAGLGAIHP